ncbi:hypothetical protein E4U58_004617 [Claviceps cyperi]|nr:hypothetical protein E4U58_004617 [Claviceps cyperi]
MTNMSKTTPPLDKIRPLNSLAGWVAWHEDMTTALRMSGFGKLLKRKRSADFAAGDLDDADAMKAEEEWQDKQDAACGAAARQLLKVQSRKK